jgi:hypothetical protein
MAVSPRKRRRRSPRKAKRASTTEWLRKALDTWPKKAAAAVGGALFASAMSYFIGADFWQGVERKVGTAGPPVQITTLTDVDRFDSDLGHFPEFIVDRPIDKVSRPPGGNTPDGRYGWAKEMGGVDASASLIRVVVSGKANTPTLLQGLRVKLVERRPALDGTLLTYTGIGSAQSVRYIQVDLGKSPPTLDYIGAEGKPEDHFPLRVSESEAEVFDIWAGSPRGDQSWYLELDYTAEGEQGTMRIDDDGKPFRTAQVSGSREDSYFWFGGRWRQP